GLGIDVANVYAAVDNTTAAQIFACGTGPEVHSLTVPEHGYLYIAAWGDNQVTQGLLAQFKRTNGFYGGMFNGPLYSGKGHWAVYATGIDYDGLPGPTLATINEQIGIADTDSGAPDLTSIGWVNDGTGGQGSCFNDLGDGYLAVGEKNDNADTLGV